MEERKGGAAMPCLGVYRDVRGHVRSRALGVF